MEQQDVFYDGAEYIETVNPSTFKRSIPPSDKRSEYGMYNLLQASGNKVSRTCILCGSKNIVLNGKVMDCN